MELYIVCNEENRIVGSGTTPLGEDSILIEINDANLNNFFENQNLYKYVNGQLEKDTAIEMDNARKTKEAELSQACNFSISNGFDFKINNILYHFSFDTEAQLNFQGAERLLNGGVVESVMWTVHLGDGYARIPITKETMDQLTIAILLHKEQNIAKFRDVLMPLVEAATTVEEVQSICWDMEV